MSVAELRTAYGDVVPQKVFDTAQVTEIMSNAATETFRVGVKNTGSANLATRAQMSRKSGQKNLKNQNTILSHIVEGVSSKFNGHEDHDARILAKAVSHLSVPYKVAELTYQTALSEVHFAQSAESKAPISLLNNDPYISRLPVGSHPDGDLGHFCEQRAKYLSQLAQKVSQDLTA